MTSVSLLTSVFTHRHTQRWRSRGQGRLSYVTVPWKMANFLGWFLHPLLSSWGALPTDPGKTIPTTWVWISAVWPRSRCFTSLSQTFFISKNEHKTPGRVVVRIKIRTSLKCLVLKVSMPVGLAYPQMNFYDFLITLLIENWWYE